mgnify:CR=1 FL=1
MMNRSIKAQLYLSDEETKMLDGVVTDRFTSEFERMTGKRPSRAEVLRRAIYFLNGQVTK